MPFAMLLTPLYKYILQTNPQSIVPLDSFTYHERVMNPLDISRRTIKDKGKRAAPSSSSSSSSDENEEPSFLQFYEELSSGKDLTDEQREKRGISSKINSPNYKRKTARMSVKPPTYVNLESSSEEHQNKRAPSPPPRKKSLSQPNSPSKSTSIRSTYHTSSSSPSESLTPTHVASPPKLRFVIPMKLGPQELPPQILSPHDPHVSSVDNWPPSPSNLSPPPRISRPLPGFSHPPPGFAHPPPRFEHTPPPQPLFVNINNNAP
ncbi:hypothetical protein Tco_0045206 [Tanacetum coccineum]